METAAYATLSLASPTTKGLGGEEPVNRGEERAKVKLQISHTHFSYL
jgi:hypothetical protein